MKGPRGPKRHLILMRRLAGRSSQECVNCKVFGKVTVDHILPISKGGSDDKTNLQFMCGPCNQAKGDKLPPGRNPVYFKHLESLKHII